MEEVELLRESNAAVGRLQQKTPGRSSWTKAKADEEIALLKQNTLKELESTKAQAEKEGRDRAASGRKMICPVRSEARMQVDASADTKGSREVRATRERAAAAALNARSLARSLTEKRLTKAQAESEARLVADGDTAHRSSTREGVRELSAVARGREGARERASDGARGAVKKRGRNNEAGCDVADDGAVDKRGRREAATPRGESATRLNHMLQEQQRRPSPRPRPRPSRKSWRRSRGIRTQVREQAVLSTQDASEARPGHAKRPPRARVNDESERRINELKKYNELSTEGRRVRGAEMLASPKCACAETDAHNRRKRSPSGTPALHEPTGVAGRSGQT